MTAKIDAQDGDRLTTSIRLPKAMIERLDEQATSREVGRNWLITRAVERYLDHLETIELP